MKHLLETYDREVRANPSYPSILKVTRTDHLVCLKGPGELSFVSYWDIPETGAAEIVREEIASLTLQNRKLMWRVYEHDRPENLETCLHSEGMEKIDSVTLMVIPLKRFQGLTIAAPTLDVVKLGGGNVAKGVEDFLTVTEIAFGQPSPHDKAYHEAILAFDNFNYYVAYRNQTPVAAARFEYPDNSRFGFLFGACVIPEYRHQGVYRFLVNLRLQQAKSLGLEYIVIDAKESSRPILERMGFITLAKGSTWTLTV